MESGGDDVLGIDLGTTNSVVALADQRGVHVLPGSDGQPLIPSTVTFHPDGRVLVGASARQRRLIDATNTIYSVKRLIGRPFDCEEVRRAQSRFAFPFVASDTGGVLVQARGERYTLSEISAFVLREVRAVAERALGRSVKKAVVTVPANFNELQRSATKAAGRVAGIDVLRILNEPTAAALAYGYGRAERERVVIFDLGGGTFDITILDLAGEIFEVAATAGDTYLGGDDIDGLIAEQMAETFLVQHRVDLREARPAYERLRAAAEWAKCQLSSQPEVHVSMEQLAFGQGGRALDLDYRLTSKGLDAMAMPLLARTFDVCERAMASAGVRPTQIDRVILVGGSTRMPLVRRMVAEYFGREPRAEIDPDLVVAQGAAIQGRSLATSRAKGRIGRVALRRAAPPKLVAAEEVTAIPHVDATGMDFDEGDLLDDLDLEEIPARPPAPPVPMNVPTPTVRPPSLRMSVPSEAQPAMPPPILAAPMVVVAAPAASDLPSLDDLPDLPAMPDAPNDPSAAPPPDANTWGDQTLAEARPPLLVDVTPLTLALETVGGFCEPIIARNAAVPTEQERTFSVGRDDQETVVLRVCQGESRRAEENQVLGQITLELGEAARRGHPISVSFMLDAGGTLAVRAVDPRSGTERTAEIRLVGEVDVGATHAMAARLDDKYAES
ncbi:MAG: Hsp70 family protein [Myxococcota bacterium]